MSVDGINGFNFSGEQPLTFISKHFSIFIQLEKAIYQANELVRFRLFAIDSQSLPYKVEGDTTITITDPSDNKIKQFSNVSYSKGKHENELLLSSAPALGTWKINVEAEGEVSCCCWPMFKTLITIILISQSFSKSFDVDEYTLPAFSAIVAAPNAVPIADGKFPVTVCAEYTFGQRVEGTAIVSFKLYGENID